MLLQMTRPPKLRLVFSVGLAVLIAILLWAESRIPSLNAGLPIGMVMVLLFTLGIFSVYSFIVVGSTITWRTAVMITGAVMIISVAAGLGAEYYQAIQIERTLEYLTN